MSGQKAELKRSVDARRVIAMSILGPQWRKCFWTWPWGHIRDGTRDRRHREICLFCGKPSYELDVLSLEEIAPMAYTYPIAGGEDKRAYT